MICPKCNTDMFDCVTQHICEKCAYAVREDDKLTRKILKDEVLFRMGSAISHLCIQVQDLKRQLNKIDSELEGMNK